jgi:hypothetical protein
VIFLPGRSGRLSQDEVEYGAQTSRLRIKRRVEAAAITVKMTSQEAAK